MTITSTGPSGFHLKPLVSVFAAAAIAAGVLAVLQLTGTDSPQSTPAPAAVSTEVVEPYIGPSGLAEALADGKLDAGLASAEGEPFAGSAPGPEIVVVEGQGGLHDALVKGKLTMDNPGVQYIPRPETGASGGGLGEALADGKLDSGLNSAEIAAFAGTAPVPEIIVIEGQGSLHDALIAGKLTMDATGVQYQASAATIAINSGLQAAFDAGKFDQDVGESVAAVPSPPATGTPMVSSGHQE